jgi:thymidylate synthase (FAD)
VTPQVHLLAATQFFGPPPEVLQAGWRPDDCEGGEALAEFAGRACYQSWGRPNPATATNAGYLAHILEVGHLSVLEHGSVSFYVTGISRSLTHELVRHRHFSYSQLSQRYVSEDDTEFVAPPAVAAVWDEPPIGGHTAGHDTVGAMFTAAVENARTAYRDLGREIAGRLLLSPGDEGMTRTTLRKIARQAARAVLPNATETRIVVTGNYRAWRHFLDMRATEHADVEIRALAIMLLRELQAVAPNVFGDFVISEHTDGTEIAASADARRVAELQERLAASEALSEMRRVALAAVPVDPGDRGVQGAVFDAVMAARGEQR